MSKFLHCAGLYFAGDEPQGGEGTSQSGKGAKGTQSGGTATLEAPPQGEGPSELGSAQSGVPAIGDEPTSEDQPTEEPEEQSGEQPTGGTPTPEQVMANTRIGKVQEYRGRITASMRSAAVGIKELVAGIANRTDADVEILLSLCTGVESIAQMVNEANQYAKATTTKDAHARAKFKVSPQFQGYLDALESVIAMGTTIPGFAPATFKQVEGQDPELVTAREVSPELFEQLYKDKCADPWKGDLDTMPLKMSFAVTARPILDTVQQARNAPQAPRTNEAGSTPPQGTNRQKMKMYDTLTGVTSSTPFVSLWTAYCIAHPEETKDAPSKTNIYDGSMKDYRNSHGYDMARLQKWAATQTHNGEPRFILSDKETGELKEALSGFENNQPVYTPVKSGTIPGK